MPPLARLVLAAALVLTVFAATACHETPPVVEEQETYDPTFPPPPMPAPDTRMPRAQELPPEPEPTPTPPPPPPPPALPE